MDSAVRRSRGALIWSLLTLVLFTVHPVHAQEAAGPAKIKVTVQPASGTAQKATCGETYKCTLPVTIQMAGKAETLTVDLFYVPGGAVLNFKTAEGYLYAGAKTQADPKYPEYAATWRIAVTSGAPSVSDITLFGPTVPEPDGAPTLSTPGNAVADLQITTEAAP